MPCNNFPRIYGLIEISDLDVMLKTCNIIDIPPKPSKKAQDITFTPKFLLAIADTVETPFVSSNMPVNIGTIKLVSKFSKLKIGISGNFKKVKICALCNIEKIIPNKTINPPIKTTELMADKILLESTSPNELNVILVAKVSGFLFSFIFLFQNLKTIPTVMQAKI